MPRGTLKKGTANAECPLLTTLREHPEAMDTLTSISTAKVGGPVVCIMKDGTVDLHPSIIRRVERKLLIDLRNPGFLSQTDFHQICLSQLH
jgi:hypothetical protein